jgi:cardiolipin synthase (CMP-forming)
MKNLPNALSALRLALAPVLLALAWSGAPLAFVGCLALSLATDVADGKIARRTGQVSERGAVLDSWADLATWASLAPAAWWLRPGFVRAEAAFLLVAVASYAVPVAIGFLRYGRLTSYHTRGARFAAYLGAASALVVFAGGPALPFRLATGVLVLAELEEIAITAVLPEWHANVPSLAHALGLRGCGSTDRLKISSQQRPQKDR